MIPAFTSFLLDGLSRFSMWALNNSASTSPKVSELLDVVQGYLWSTRDRVESELLGSILVRFALIGILLVSWLVGCRVWFVFLWLRLGAIWFV